MAGAFQQRGLGEDALNSAGIRPCRKTAGRCLARLTTAGYKLSEQLTAFGECCAIRPGGQG